MLALLALRPLSMALDRHEREDSRPASMKFFTAQWAHGSELSEEEQNAVLSAYATHVNGLLPALPATIHALARGVDLHDGLLRGVTLDRPRRRRALGLRCGELQKGYFDIDLIYQDVALADSNLAELSVIARDPKAEALYDEVDAGGSSLWVHRIRFWPFREVSFSFRALAMHLEPREDRVFDRLEDPYVEIPDGAV